MYETAKAPSSAGPRILVVRLGAMGDIVHALPAVATLKHSFPNSHVTWAVEPKWACLLDGNPFLDALLPAERHTLRGFVETWRNLRGMRFDWAVDFQGLVKSALLASVARPERIYGFHQSQVRERAAALFYSNKVLSRAPHVVDRNLELAATAGAASMLRSFPLPSGVPEGELPEEDFILASPLAGWTGKQWPLSYYETLAQLLWEECRLPLVLDGPPSVADLLSQVTGVRWRIGGVAGLVHATRKALAVVGIDSGPMHLAAALGKPGVAIFGPTDPARNGPYGGSLAVLRGPSAVTTYRRRNEIDPAMWEIKPAAVFETLREQLSRRSRSAGGAD